ncbi:MAG TPA: PIG-L family deacetylase [Kofleriaceae bacterium]|nr:PIG-L family deacetylase [Kofleriaceae bacterium]
MARARAIFLSPHLDDAVLSAGALIARRVAAGDVVEVWTFFTQGPPLETLPPERRVFGDYTTRLDEDARALAKVGATRRLLGFVERIWREPMLARTRDVFTTPRERDFPNVPAMRAVVREALASGADVYAPLGIGNHVDHVEVALACAEERLTSGAVAASDAAERLRFYEDPYALGAACRRRHFVARRRRWNPLRGPSWASPRVGGLLRYVAHAAHGPGLDTYAPALRDLDWRCEPAPVERFEDAKLAAIAEYGSQVAAFGGMARLSAFMRRGHALTGGEPIWRA